jgi:3',5'-cyclic AMP phosphodiesterase CpdA
MDNGWAAARWIDRFAPDLVVHLGDVTADGIKDPAQFDAAASVLGSVQAPLRVLPGNHDVGEAPSQTGGHEPALDLARLGQFRAAFGPDAWMHRLAGWTLLGLNAQAFGHGEAEAEQWRWLDETLAQAAGPLGLFIHKPLTHHGIAPDDDHPRYVPPAARGGLAARFAGRDLRFVASGHVHQALQSEIGGVRRLWVPSCAFIIPDSVQPVIGDKIVGLMTLELSDAEAHADIVIPPGVRQNNVMAHPEVYPQVAGMAPRGAGKS